MFGFPIPLYNSGSSSVKMTTDADSGFIKPVVREIFYSIKDGNWNDITVWQTASGRVGLLPTANDDVYVRHSINTNITANTTTTVNNLYISVNGTIVMTGGGGLVTLSILGNFQCQGLFNGSGGQGHVVKLFGTDNRIDNYLFSASTTIAYTRNGDQYILNLNYYHLSIDGIGTKYLQSNIVLLGNFNNQGLGNGLAILECGCYDFTVNGTSSIRCSFSKNNSGNLLFIGAVTIVISSSSSGFYGFILSGNPNVEFRGGIDFNNLLAPFNSGTGTWSFTTNNQTILRSNSTSTLSFDCKINIANGITLTTNTQSLTSVFNFNDIINGLGATSKLLQASNSGINFATKLAAENSMTTGTWDFTTNANTIQYSGNYSATIPSYFTTFSSITIGGTGTKTLSANTTLNANLSITSRSTNALELSIYNLTVNGTTSITGTLSKSGSGSILFVGLVSLVYDTTTTYLTFTGNPTVEFRNGLTMTTGTYSITSGSGQWSFTTNSQPLTISGYQTLTFDCPILISGAITLTYAYIGANPTAIFNGTINGDNANSKLLMGLGSGNTTALNYRSATQPMATGILDASTNLNTWIYGLGNQNIKGGPTTLAKQVYRNLTLNGGGTKTLQGYVSVQNTYTLTSPATLALNGYTLTNP